MKNLHQLFNQSNPELQEHELQLAINKMLDQKLKKELINSLEIDYLVKKETNVVNLYVDAKESKTQLKTRIFNIKKIASVAAVFLILLCSYLYMTSLPNTFELANQFAHINIVSHPGLTKGVNESDQIRIDAIKAFNNKQWHEAAQSFKAFSEPNAESIYYTGMSYFYNKEYSAAITNFHNSLLTNSVYSQEVKWFLGLAYILNGQEEQGKKVLNNIKSNEWKYEEAKKLLK